MRVLGIETATAVASVGVVTGEVVVECHRAIAASHARELLPLIDEALMEAGIALRGIELVAVSIGPGSFTGLRIGLSVAKGLAFANGVPIIGVSTLEAYAASLGSRPGWIWPVLDARKGEVYAAGYCWSGEALRCIAAPSVIEAAAFADRLEAPSLLLGDGVDTYAEIWAAAAACPFESRRLADAPPSGVAVARLAALRLGTTGAGDLATLEPAYCRRPDAERNGSVVVSAR